MTTNELEGAIIQETVELVLPVNELTLPRSRQEYVEMQTENQKYTSKIIATLVGGAIGAVRGSYSESNPYLGTLCGGLLGAMAGASLIKSTRSIVSGYNEREKPDDLASLR